MNNCYREHSLWVFLSTRSTIHACPPRHGRHIQKKGNQRNHIIMLKCALGEQIWGNLASADSVMAAYDEGSVLRYPTWRCRWRYRWQFGLSGCVTFTIALVGSTHLSMYSGSSQDPGRVAIIEKALLTDPISAPLPLKQLVDLGARLPT